MEGFNNGKNLTNVKHFLEKRYTEDMELDDVVHTTILKLKEGFEGKISITLIVLIVKEWLIGTKGR